MMTSLRPALAAFLLVAACGESAEKPASEETAPPQDVEYTADFAAATREAAADTEAAIRDAGASRETPVVAPAEEAAARAAAAGESAEDVEP